MLPIDEQEILRRRDMREVFTFTIDPADAKDFDDALSYQVLEDGLVQVGVHIADVSHYVQPGDAVDEEAYKRGTSTYLVDRVLPMLPEELCNDLCSLRPHEDKLCMSVVFTMTQEAEVVKHKICRTVIRSDARLDYDEAQEMIERPSYDCQTALRAERQKTVHCVRYQTDIVSGSGLGVDGVLSSSPAPCPPPRKRGGGVPGDRTSMRADNDCLMEAIQGLDRLARILRGKRFEAGALVLEQDEMRFRLDEQGEPVEIYFERPNEAHHLIEEFMLLANRTVAEAVGKKPFVYRIHDKPDKEKLRELKAFQKRMGKRVPAQVIDMLTVRAMAKAKYSTHNIGHYGLAFKHYTHFTSPIRRYPDLMVHRLLEKYILKGKGDSLPRNVLEEMCIHCSEREIDAQQAERDSNKMYQAKWMKQHIGEEADGHISGVTDFGVFVQLDESRCEGLVRINRLVPGDYMVYDEKNYRLIAEESGKTFTLGDPMRVKIIRADAEKRQIDFKPAEKG
ncbi:MAG: RNB domain-containing ribonuclease [Paludibacteraceae bacterium]|nr:RNB domain-containing ribonuclease [Paludibacteraceae bacterium]